MPLTHHTLVAWQRADDLFIKIHVLCRTLPAIERYELASQARRSGLASGTRVLHSRRAAARLHLGADFHGARSRREEDGSALERLDRSIEPGPSCM